MKLKLPVVVIVAGVLTSAVSVKASTGAYPQSQTPGISDSERFSQGSLLYNIYSETPDERLKRREEMNARARAEGVGMPGAPGQRFVPGDTTYNVSGRVMMRENLMRSDGGDSYLNGVKRRNSGKNRGGADVFNEFFMHPLRFIPFATSIANHYDADKLARCKERIHWGIPVSDEERIKCAAFDLRLQWEKQTTAWGYIVDFILSAIVFLVWFFLICGSIGAIVEKINTEKEITSV